MRDPLWRSVDGSAEIPDLHCNLYVNLETPQVAEDLVVRLSGDRPQAAALRYRSLGISVAHNDYRTDGGDPSGFLQWGTVLECEPDPGAPSEQVVSDVRDIIASLRRAGYSVEADCLYEEELTE
ncbi:hypothetical protein [Streptomyces sp. NPDC088557]|uniref:hypothetical protein n=1 Tax=Streptomyces sp. NPDC088557 TaxID=3365867 RepID=UPI003810CE0B